MSARRVSSVCVFSRGPARPTPIRAGVLRIIRSNDSRSCGASNNGTAFISGEVMSTPASWQTILPPSACEADFSFLGGWNGGGTGEPAFPLVWMEEGFAVSSASTSCTIRSIVCASNPAHLPFVKIVGSPARLVRRPSSIIPIFSSHCSNSGIGRFPRMFRMVPTS